MTGTHGSTAVTALVVSAAMTCVALPGSAATQQSAGGVTADSAHLAAQVSPSDCKAAGGKGVAPAGDSGPPRCSGGKYDGQPITGDD
jgi:hypothetical protein